MLSLQQIKKDYREICEKVDACKTVGDLQRLSTELNTPIEINGEDINNYSEFENLTGGKRPNYIRVEEYGSLDYIYFQSDTKGSFRCTYFDVSDKNNGISFLSDVTMETLDAMYQKAIVPWGATKCDCFMHRGFCVAVVDTGDKATVEIFATNEPSETPYPQNSPLIDSLTTNSCAKGLSLSELTPVVKAYINDNYDRLLVETMAVIPDYRGVLPITDEIISALNTRKSPDDLLSLSRSDNVEDRIMAAQDRYSGWDILNALAADKDDRVKLAVVKRNQDQSLCLLAEDPNVDIRIAVAEKGVLDTRIAPAASGKIRYNDPDPKYRAFMAKTFPSVYYEDPSPEVRQVVAEQGSHLETLMYDKNPLVRVAARSYIEENKETMLPSQYKDLTTSSYECLRLAHSPFNQERLKAANSPRARDDVLEMLKDDEDVFVRCAVAARGYALPQYINDPSYLVRAEVARCGYGLDTLSNDPEKYVREAVEQTRKDIRCIMKQHSLLNEGDEVCISTKELYERFGERLSHGHISVETGEGCNYYDMYNSEGVVCCMDGEANRVESINADNVVFVNEDGEEPIRFTLSTEEVEVAVFQAYQKDMDIAAPKKKSEIER